MLAKLEDHRFLAVVGTSGCGKSSLVRAGLIPALKQGFMLDTIAVWRVAKMRPGTQPFSRLTKALLEESAIGQERGNDDNAVAYSMATLRRGPLGLVEAVQESHLEAGTNLLVLVDQFEEIFRYREQTTDAAEEATAFVNVLLASGKPSVVRRKLSDEIRIYVVITMRSDFIGDCTFFTGLPEAINDSQFLTPRLTRAQYRLASVEPARVFGGELEPDLVNRRD
jgi:energy-coupling factor transporter ATP-binding protein EcfA2